MDKIGTKSNPGRFDCYANVYSNEPIFVLRAEDPLAFYLVELWAACRSKDSVKAVAVFSSLITKAHSETVHNHEKIASAYDIVDSMLQWTRYSKKTEDE